MEMLLGSSGFMFIGLAIAFWLLTTKKFRKENGEVISQYVSKNLRGLSNGAQQSNELALLEFEAELKEYGVSLTESSKKLKEWEAYHSTKGVN